MRAIIYDAEGGPEVLRAVEIAEPACTADGIVIRVRAIAIEGGEVVRRATERPSGPGHVLGYAAAGEIVAVGSRVRDLKVGQRVATMGMEGAYAEFRAVPAAAACPVPDGFDIGRAAALPIPFATAHRCLFGAGRLAKGETVLVQAGAGGVGLAAIQLAAQAVARVLATVSGRDRIERLRGLGLDEAIDHRREDVAAAARRLTDGRGVDLVVDPVGGASLQRSIAALRDHGRLVFVGNAAREPLVVDLWPALQANNQLTGVFMGTELTSPETHAALRTMLEDAAAGRLEVVVDRRFSLEQAAEAHRHIEDNAILGRVLLVP